MRRLLKPELLLWVLSAAAFGLLAWYFAVGHGRLDYAHHARGRDFVIFWTAGQLLREGRVREIFDPVAFMAAAHRLFSPRLPFHFWSYPPPALLLIAPLAAFKGYFAALLAWTAAGLVAVWAALRLATSPVHGGGREADGGGEPQTSRVGFAPSTLLRRVPLPRFAGGALLLLSPAVATNIAFGQNGAFTAALLLGGLALVDRRPWTAGALLGLLIFKPQLALLLPVVVIAGRRWRVMGGAAASAAVLVVLSTAIFGLDAWRAFFDHTLPMQTAMLQHGRGPFRWMMPSAFMSLRLLGMTYGPAILAQVPFTLLGGWFAWRAWRRPETPLALRIAVLVIATFVATPQAFNYDLIPTAVAALVLWRAGGRWFDLGLAALVWALPVAMIGLGYWHAPLAPVVLTLAAWRLSQLAARPSFAASASAAGEAASNT